MKRFFLIAFLVLSCSWAIAYESNCPHVGGEAYACEFEQKRVIEAKRGLTPFVQLTYCGVNSPYPMACRKLIRFKDTNGNLSENYFEEWFVADPDTALQENYRGFFVKGDRGLFNLYWDDYYEGSLMGDFLVDFSSEDQKDIAVKFDGWSPNYSYVSDTHTLLMKIEVSHDLNRVNIKKHKSVKSKESVEILNYYLLSTHIF